MIIDNYIYLVSPFVGWIVAQLVKVIINSKNKINWRSAVQSGGMPSSHSAFMVALSMSIGLGEGFDSVIFAVVMSVTLIIMYDATDVRFTTGQQTDAINEIAKKTNVKILKIHDAKGHTIKEVVAGAIVGILVAIAMSVIL